eukprot:GHVT01033775.1.p1 GENE.GHVT01033775.1~~GHVT01033775.1.p1  ORF type:complete len:642 (-),score=174.01 GHVT01033775.1:806-2731(-)
MRDGGAPRPAARSNGPPERKANEFLPALSLWPRLQRRLCACAAKPVMALATLVLLLLTALGPILMRNANEANTTLRLVLPIAAGLAIYATLWTRACLLSLRDSAWPSSSPPSPASSSSFSSASSASSSSRHSASWQRHLIPAPFIAAGALFVSWAISSTASLSVCSRSSPWDRTFIACCGILHQLRFINKEKWLVDVANEPLPTLGLSVRNLMRSASHQLVVTACGASLLLCLGGVLSFFIRAIGAAPAVAPIAETARLVFGLPLLVTTPCPYWILWKFSLFAAAWWTFALLDWHAELLQHFSGNLDQEALVLLANRFPPHDVDADQFHDRCVAARALYRHACAFPLVYDRGLGQWEVGSAVPPPAPASRLQGISLLLRLLFHPTAEADSAAMNKHKTSFALEAVAGDQLVVSMLFSNDSLFLKTYVVAVCGALEHLAGVLVQLRALHSEEIFKACKHSVEKSWAFSSSSSSYIGWNGDSAAPPAPYDVCEAPPASTVEAAAAALRLADLSAVLVRGIVRWLCLANALRRHSPTIEDAFYSIVARMLIVLQQYCMLKSPKFQILPLLDARLRELSLDWTHLLCDLRPYARLVAGQGICRFPVEVQPIVMDVFINRPEELTGDFNHGMRQRCLAPNPQSYPN